MTMLTLIMLGYHAYKNAPIDRFPDVDFPVIVVSTTYEGANPYVVDTQVTQIIEEAVASIGGIEAIASKSFSNSSQVTLIFDLEKDIDVAADEVRSAVQRSVNRLPEGADIPVVIKLNTSLAPMMAILVYGDAPEERLHYFADKVVKRTLERVNGVGTVHIGGFRDRALWIRIDPIKLSARNVTIPEVIFAFQKHHSEQPSGSIYSANREYTLRLFGKFTDPEEVNSLVIRDGVRLRDIGWAEFSYEERRSVSRANLKPSLVVVVYKESKANTVETADRVYEKLRELEKIAPAGIKMTVNFDSSEFIRRSVNDAVHEIILGSVLTGLTVLAFLGSLRLSLIPVSAIPISILGAMFVINLFGYSLNIITLIAFAVAVGIVIDDAIVVLESIYRRNEEGLRGNQAADVGTRTVIFALLSSTSSIIVIFAPILFMEGPLGEFFKNFAFTLIVSIAISFFVSVSLTPMLSARLIKGTFSNPFMRAYGRFESAFDRALRWALDHKLLVFILVGSTVVVGIQLAKVVKKELFPVIDEGRFFIRFETPQGSSLDFSDRKAREIERILVSNPYVDRYGMFVGEGLHNPSINGGMFFVTLTERSKRPHQKEIMNMVRDEIKKIKDVKASVEVPSVVGARGGRQVDVQYVVKGDSLEELSKIARRLTRYLEEIGGYSDIDTDISTGNPEVRVVPIRERLYDLGITSEDLALTLNALFGKLAIGTYEVGSESYNVYIKAKEDFLKSYENLKKIYLRSKTGELVPLDYLVRVELAPGYTVINRYNRQYSFMLFANLRDKSPAEAVREIESYLKDTLPHGYSFEPEGMTKEFKRSFKQLGIALIIAVAGVYMILASLFESLIHPFTVMLTLPLAIFGVFGFLIITGNTLNEPSYFGIILLMGLVARDSVLFIERIIQLRSEGQEVREAIMKARKERLRPILMTTITIIFALLPVALGINQGGEIRKPLALAVIGGLTTALPLSLFVIPVVYELIEGIKAKLRRSQTHR